MQANIRVIRKVIRVVNQILRNRLNLVPAVLSRVIPSTVLLAAIHYKGIDGGPTFEYVLGAGSSEDWSDFLAEDEQPSPIKIENTKWKQLLRELGNIQCDEFELIIFEYLKSGLYDDSAVSAIIDRYVDEADKADARERSRTLLDHLIWHHTLTDQELVAEAVTFLPVAHLLDPFNLTTLMRDVSSLTGGNAVAQQMLSNWIAEFKGNPWELGENNIFNRPIHPIIQAEFDGVVAGTQASTTVYDACVYIFENSGWGPRQELVLKSATVQDIETIIRTLDVVKLRLFMRKFIEFCRQRQNYEQHFGSAVKHFLEACRNINSDAQAGRLPQLIRTLFNDAGLSAELNPAPQPAPEGAAVAK